MDDLIEDQPESELTRVDLPEPEVAEPEVAAPPESEEELVLEDLSGAGVDAEPPADPIEIIAPPTDGIPQNLTSTGLPDFSKGFKGPSKESKESAEKTIALPMPTRAPEQVGDDPTVRLRVTSVDVPVHTSAASAARSLPQETEEQIRTSVGRHGALRNTSSPSSAALAQSENLRIAQGRILELENEVERLRRENEQLGAAGETFRRKSDELTSQVADLDNKYQNAVSTHSQEKELLLENKESLRGENEQLRARSEELELRISTNIQKIRVRERELENRLELVKMEGSALIRSKDELILDLKRQIDQLNLELNNYRTKGQELNRMILDKQDILRRTVKALRLALTMLEGDEASSVASVAQKKAK